MFGCGPLLRENVSLMMIGLDTSLWIEQNIIRNHLIVIFPNLVLWAIQPLLLVIRQNGIIDSLSCHGLSVRSINCWQFPQVLCLHSCNISFGQVAGWRICGWVGIPFSHVAITWLQKIADSGFVSPSVEIWEFHFPQSVRERWSERIWEMIGIRPCYGMIWKPLCGHFLN